MTTTQGMTRMMDLLAGHTDAELCEMLAAAEVEGHPRESILCIRTEMACRGILELCPVGAG